MQVALGCCVPAARFNNEVTKTYLKLVFRSRINVFIMPRPRRAFWNNAIRPSPSDPRRSFLGYRHAGCLQLSHRRPPDLDPPRFFGSNCHRRGHKVSPSPCSHRRRLHRGEVPGCPGGVGAYENKVSLQGRRYLMPPPMTVRAKKPRRI